MRIIQLQHSSVHVHYFAHKIRMVSHCLGSDFFTLHKSVLHLGGQEKACSLPLNQNGCVGLQLARFAS